MDISLKTFNGFSLNNSNYRAAVITSKNPPEASPVFIQQAESDSEDSGTYTLGVLPVPIGVHVIGTGRNALESQLKEALKPGTIGQLVVTFNDEAEDYQKECRVQSVTANTKAPGYYTVVLQTGESAWQKVTADTSSWAVDASGDTKSITVGGYSETCLSLDLEPLTAPAGGWAYQRLYQLINKLAINHGTRPWMIELDTAALVTAGKMQADCDDLIVLVDGLQVKRWLADANTDHTAIWINLKLDAGQSIPLKTAIGATGAITEMVFVTSAVNLKALNALPARGYVIHGTEWFEYYSKVPGSYKLLISCRGALGTTLQAHAASDVFQWVQHSIILLYGNPTASSPSTGDDTYDNDKPVFDLAASTNTSWAYTASTLFYDPLLPNRPGSWKPIFTRLGDVSEIYHASQDVDGAAPAMGMKMGSWIKLGKQAAESASLRWQFNHPGGITTVSMTGSKYRATITWPGSLAAQLQRGSTATAFLNVWTEATPSAAATWEAVTHASVSITGTLPWIQFLLAGSMKAEAGSLAALEVLTATVVFVTANQPDGSMLAEKASFLLDVVIENTTNGDQVGLLVPLLLNTHLVVDGESHEVTLDGVNAQTSLVVMDKSRDVWVRLDPGTNVISITGDNIGTLTIGLSWKERRI